MLYSLIIGPPDRKKGGLFFCMDNADNRFCNSSLFLNGNTLRKQASHKSRLYNQDLQAVFFPFVFP